MKRILSLLLVALLLLAATPVIAEETGLKAGLYTADQTNLYLNEDGVGIFTYQNEKTLSFFGVVWTADALSIEGMPVPFTTDGGTLAFAYEGQDCKLAYKGVRYANRFGEADKAGYYRAESGEQLVLSANGRALYTDAKGRHAAWWGTLSPYYTDMVPTFNHFLIVDSIADGLYFDGKNVTILMADGASVSLEQEDTLDAYGTDIIGTAQNFRFCMPVTGWTQGVNSGAITVTSSETEDSISMFMLLGVALEYASIDMLKEVANSALRQGLANVGAVYDPAQTVWEDYPIGFTMGQMASASYQAGGYTLDIDGVLWHTDGTLYMVLHLSTEDMAEAARKILDATLLTFETNASAAQKGELYNLYMMKEDDETYDFETILSYGYNPRSTFLLLRPDGTGYLQIFDEEDAGEIEWTETTISIGSTVSIACEKNGDHLVLTLEDESIEFAPAAEVNALLTATVSANAPTGELAEAVTGDWELSGAKAMGQDLTAEQLKGSLTLSLTMNADGSAVLTTNGNSSNYRWRVEEEKVILFIGSYDAFTITCDGEQLSMDVMGISVFLTRAN